MHNLATLASRSPEGPHHPRGAWALGLTWRALWCVQRGSHTQPTHPPTRGPAPSGSRIGTRTHSPRAGCGCLPSRCAGLGVQPSARMVRRWAPCQGSSSRPRGRLVPGQPLLPCVAPALVHAAGVLRAAHNLQVPRQHTPAVVAQVVDVELALGVTVEQDRNQAVHLDGDAPTVAREPRELGVAVPIYCAGPDQALAVALGVPAQPWQDAALHVAGVECVLPVPHGP